MKSFAIRLLGLLFCYSSAAFAAPVDGYKDIKFGASIADVKNKAKCSAWAPLNLTIYPKGFVGFMCSGFSFAGDKKYARFVFSEGKFLELMIMDVPVAALDALKVKYPDFAGITDDELKAYQIGTSKTLSAFFASQTVEFQASADGQVLFYRSPQFETYLKKANLNKFSDAL